MSTANPNRTRVCLTCGTANTCVKCGCCLPGGALVCDDCMNGVCEHTTASTTQPTRAQKEFRAVYESLSAPESDERTTEVGEPLYTLTGLTALHMASIVQGLWDTIHHEYSREDDITQAHDVLRLISESNYPHS